MSTLTFNHHTTGRTVAQENLTRDQVEHLGGVANRHGVNTAVTNPYGRNVTRLFRVFDRTLSRYLAQPCPGRTHQDHQGPVSGL